MFSSNFDFGSSSDTNESPWTLTVSYLLLGGYMLGSMYYYHRLNHIKKFVSRGTVIVDDNFVILHTGSDIEPEPVWISSQYKTGSVDPGTELLLIGNIVTDLNDRKWIVPTAACQWSGIYTVNHPLSLALKVLY